MAQRSKLTVDERALTSCVWARFSDRFPQYACRVDSTVSPLLSFWVKGACVFSCNLQPTLTAATRGWNKSRDKSQQQKIYPGGEKSPPLKPGIEPVTFQSQSSTTELHPRPILVCHRHS